MKIPVIFKGNSNSVIKIIKKRNKLFILLSFIMGSSETYLIYQTAFLWQLVILTFLSVFLLGLMLIFTNE